MADITNVGEQIDDIISSALGIDRTEFTDDTDLGPEGLGVDSITMVEIVELVEMQVGISISDEDLDGFDGSDVGDLKEFVKTQKEAEA